MHPYEMAATMRSQGKERSIKLNYGSLYTVVDNLAKHGLIEAMEASREGRRPERTVYRLTDEGRAELEDWMTELLGAPVKEYPQFEAAPVGDRGAPPDQVRDVLSSGWRPWRRRSRERAEPPARTGCPGWSCSRTSTAWRSGKPSWTGCAAWRSSSGRLAAPW